MSPADGAMFDVVAGASPLVPDLAIILPGGRTLLAISQLDLALPRQGYCGDALWRATCWPTHEGRAGLALVAAPMVGAGLLRGSGGQEHMLDCPRAVDVAPTLLVDFVQRNGLSSRLVFDFLVGALAAAAGGEALPGDHEFAGRFLSSAAEPAGFVEVLACPDTGGLFAQGWSMSLAAGRHRLAWLGAGLQICDADVVVFAREDIAPPGTGFCMFSLDWRGGDLDGLECLFYEQGDGLQRLDLVRGSVVMLDGEPASEHVRQMLPRLAGDGTAIQRICRPRYQGLDTLSGTSLPVAAALDAVFEAPGGELLVAGWLLDPLQRVERVIIKSRSGLYAPLQDCWNPLPRPDLNEGFAGDQRFARLLSAADCNHGFIAYAPGKPRCPGDDFYLELVLDDKSCLFRPLKVVHLEGRELLPQILSSVPMHDATLDVIIDDILAPFLSALPARRRNARASQRPIDLSNTQGEIPAVVPLSRFDHLLPMMALLAGTEEAERLDLTIVMARGEAGQAVSRLGDLFSFYGLRGRLLLVPDQADPCARIEAGLAMATGRRVLLWSPAALPATVGWLATLESELAGCGTPGLISPTLVYEDGSVFYGGDRAVGPDDAAMLGYPLGWMTRGEPCAMPFGAAQLALVDRDAMSAAGGFSGALYSDQMIHRDLGRRLKECGYGSWASRSVDFWILEEHRNPADAAGRLLERVDSSLMGKISASVTGDRIR